MQRATSYGTLFSMRPDERGIRYVRPIEPLHFPSSDPEWEMSESHRHGRLCELLYDLLRRALPDEEACLGTDQFVYFDASNARKKCAPDAFVKLGAKAEPTSVWLTWKRGAPELCVEILSPSDTKEKLTLTEKLRRFHAIGVSEVVAFDVDAPAGSRLRAWDLVDGDLVERVVEDERTPCLTLGAYFVVAPHDFPELSAQDRLPAALRLAADPQGTQLFPSTREVARADREARLAEHEARLAAEAEVENVRARAAHEHARAEAALEEISRLREELERARRP